MKFCQNCGAQLSDGVKFCTECGAKIVQPEPPAPPVCEAPVQAVQEPPAEPAYAPPAEPAYEPPKPPVYTPQVKEKTAKRPREKKPANKKGLLFAAIGVAAVLVIVLLASLLGGKNQGEPADWGRYDAVSAEGEWIELEKKGKATLYIMDSAFKAAWELDGEAFTLEQSGDTYTGTLKDGVLRIDLAGTEYVFAREGTVTGPVTYKAVTGISHGQILDEELMELIGGCYLVMNGDGTGTLYLFGEALPVTYTDTTVTMGGEAMEYTWKGDTMVLTFADGSSFDLVATDEKPAASGQPEMDWETGEMETEILSYLNWPGQTFSTMDLSDATLSLQGTWGEATVWFKTDAGGNSVVESMNFYVETGSYDELRQMLVSAYGEPTDEGEEPYVESNGGAVAYCWFEHPAGTLRLSAASEYDFMEILVNTD